MPKQFSINLITLSLLLLNSSYAEDVYKWVDKDGTVHYGTEDSHPKAKKTELPTLMRENIDSRIESIKMLTPKNCQKHGGIDCSRGADADGSVFCLDGFSEALLPFRFACVEVRLETLPPTIFQIESPENRQVLGEINVNQFSSLSSYRIQTSVRNLSGNEAMDVRVRFFVPSFGEFDAIGPEVLEPYGLADYTLSLKNLSEELEARHLRKGSVRVKCKNCAGIINRQK